MSPQELAIISRVLQHSVVHLQHFLNSIMPWNATDCKAKSPRWPGDTVRDCIWTEAVEKSISSPVSRLTASAKKIRALALGPLPFGCYGKRLRKVVAATFFFDRTASMFSFIYFYVEMRFCRKTGAFCVNMRLCDTCMGATVCVLLKLVWSSSPLMYNATRQIHPDCHDPRVAAKQSSRSFWCIRGFFAFIYCPPVI